MSTKDFNPRYVLYAASQQRTPEMQIRHDEQRWPGGCMTGFILWMNERKAEFKKISPDSFLGNWIYDQAAWDNFLFHFCQTSLALMDWNNRRQHGNQEAAKTS